MRAGRTIAHSMPESDFNRRTTTTIKVVLYWNTGLHRQCTHSTLPPPPLPSPHPILSGISEEQHEAFTKRKRSPWIFMLPTSGRDGTEITEISSEKFLLWETTRAHAPFTITTRTSELLTSQPFSDVCLSCTRLNVRQTCTWTLDVVCSKASYVETASCHKPLFFFSFIVVKRSVLFVSVSYWEKGCFSCTTISPLTGNILRPWKAGPQQQPNELIRKKKMATALEQFHTLFSVVFMTQCFPPCPQTARQHVLDTWFQLDGRRGPLDKNQRWRTDKLMSALKGCDKALACGSSHFKAPRCWLEMDSVISRLWCSVHSCAIDVSWATGDSSEISEKFHLRNIVLAQLTTFSFND